ncbi:MAG: hypothetical protein AB1486_21850 [Planctomycetota bacterium]
MNTKIVVGTTAAAGGALRGGLSPAGLALRVAPLLVAGFTLFGCEFFRPELQNPSPVESRAFEDIPVPADFQLNRDSRSGYSYSEGVLRTGQFEYEGSVPACDVADFYRFQMPLAGWNPRLPADLTKTPPSASSNEPVEMEFTKGRYLARIRIAESPATSWRAFSTTILVTLETD